MKMIEVGTNMNGDPVYNVTKDDGSLFKTTIFTKDEAQALIDGESESPVIPVDSFNNKSQKNSVENYNDMTKKELEIFMRTHNIELDRRKSKTDLLAQVDDFFKE